MFMKVIATGSSGNCYALASGNDILLLDCGVPYKEILKGIGYRISDVKAVLLTHRHFDHSKSYKDFLKAGIPIYTNDETVEHFNIVSGERMYGLPERKPIKIGSFSVIPFYLPHTDTDRESMEIISCANFGWIVTSLTESQSMIYATDFQYIPYVFKKQAIIHWLIECNHIQSITDKTSRNYEHVLRGHSDLETVKGIIKANWTYEMRSIILCHLSETNSDEQMIVNEISMVAGDNVNVEIAEKDHVYCLGNKEDILHE